MFWDAAAQSESSAPPAGWVLKALDPALLLSAPP